MLGTIFCGVAGAALAFASPWLRVYGKAVEVMALLAAFVFIIAFIARVF